MTVTQVAMYALVRLLVITCTRQRALLSFRSVRAQPSRAPELAALLRAIRHHALSDAEPGCTGYRIVASAAGDDDGEFVCIEEYTDEAAVAAHAAQNPGVQKLVAALQTGHVFLGAPTILGPLRDI
ncbi:hypothetical protein JCM3770_001966 [Rhodotorula araucariae]